MLTILNVCSSDMESVVAGAALVKGKPVYKTEDGSGNPIVLHASTTGTAVVAKYLPYAVDADVETRTESNTIASGERCFIIKKGLVRVDQTAHDGATVPDEVFGADLYVNPTTGLITDVGGGQANSNFFEFVSYAGDGTPGLLDVIIKG